MLYQHKSHGGNRADIIKRSCLIVALKSDYYSIAWDAFAAQMGYPYTSLEEHFRRSSSISVHLMDSYDSAEEILQAAPEFVLIDPPFVVANEWQRGRGITGADMYRQIDYTDTYMVSATR